MGSIQTVTPENGVEPRETIQRLKSIPPASEIAEKGHTPLEVYPASAGNGLKKVSVKIAEEEPGLKPTVTSKLNTLWMYLKYKSNDDYTGWNDFMDMLTEEQHFEMSTINFFTIH